MADFCAEHQYAYSGEQCPGCNYTDSIDVSNVVVDVDPPQIDMSNYWQQYMNTQRQLERQLLLFVYGVSDM